MTDLRLHRRKTIAALTAVVLAAGGVTGAVAGSASGQDTSAVAVNTKDGSTVFKLQFKILRVNGDTVDNGNAAVAYANCDLCQTVAISIQVLLVASDPTVFDPTNLALAYNENCTLCDTLASAYQFAFGVGSQLKFTAEGRRELAAIRHELDGLRHSGLSGSAIQGELDAYMQQLSSVLASQLIGGQEPAGNAPTDTAAPPSTTDTTTQPAPATETQPTQAEPPPATTTTDTQPTTTTDTTSTTPTQTETTPTTTDTTSATPGG